MKKPHDATLLVARILIVSVFLFSGSLKIMRPAWIMHIMAAAGIPMVHAAWVVTILIEFGCSVLVAAGLKARWAAIPIILWLTPATIIFHFPTHQWTEVLKNLGLMGALAIIIDVGPGAYSLDAILSRRSTEPSPGTAMNSATL
jgi:putative oxidoreductase